MAVQVLERVERVVHEAGRLLGVAEGEGAAPGLAIGLRADRPDVRLDRHGTAVLHDPTEPDDGAPVTAELVREELAVAQLLGLLGFGFLPPAAFCAAWETISASTKPSIRVTTVPGRRTTRTAGESVVPRNLTIEFALRSS